MSQREHWIGPCGQKFLCDEACVSGSEDSRHDSGVVDFLQLIKFFSAWVAGGVVVCNELVILFDSADDIAVHDLDVVDIEQQPEVGGIHAAYQIEAAFDIITEIPRVSFHGV